MKTIIICALLAVAGCATTAGEWNKNLNSTEPYTFVHSFDEQKVREIVKLTLLSNDWEISTDELGYIVSTVRDLKKDEFVVNTQFFGDFTDSEVYKADGRLRFHLNGQKVEMSGEVTKQSGNRLEVTQGYPLMMKYRRLLEKQGFKVQ